MNTLLQPIPLWVFVVVLFAVAVIVDFYTRRLRRRMDHMDRVIDNMDRWADEIEGRLEQHQEKPPRFAVGAWNRASNRNAKS